MYDSVEIRAPSRKQHLGIACSHVRNPTGMQPASVKRPVPAMRHPTALPPNHPPLNTSFKDQLVKRERGKGEGPGEGGRSQGELGKGPGVADLQRCGGCHEGFRTT